MKAMILHNAGDILKWEPIEAPVARYGEVLRKVTAGGICKADLHIIDRELTGAPDPLIPRHTGYVEDMHPSVKLLNTGEEVGVSCLGKSPKLDGIDGY